MKDYDKIIKSCNKLLSIDSNNINAYLYIGQAHGSLNQFDEAIKYFDAAIAISDYHADLNYEKCKIYLRMDYKAAAYECIEKALNEDEEFIDYIDENELKALKGYKSFDQLFFL